MTDFWKQRLFVVVLMVLVLILGIAIGRNTVPTKIEKDTQYLTQYQEKVVEQERTQVALTLNVVTDAKVDRVVVTEVKPDGTKTITEHDHSENHSETAATKTEIQTVEVTKEVKVVDMVKVHELVENAKPQWRIGVHAGLDIPSLTKPGSNPDPLIIGGSVDRRILGPIFMGVWGNNKLQGGVGVSIEF